MKRRGAFTLIELLIVMAIIAILMAMLLGGLSAVRNRGKEVRARAEISSIVTACKTYEGDYGFLPPIDTSDVALSTVTGSPPSVDNKYKSLFNMLTCVTYQTSTSVAYNPRNIRYLEVPGDYGTKGYLDPWGASYGIALDFGYDGSIALGTPLSTTLNTSVAAWSRGTTGGSFATTESTKNYILSWK